MGFWARSDSRAMAQAEEGEARSTMQPPANRFAGISTACRDITFDARNRSDEFFLTRRAAVVVARKRGDTTAPAFLPMNFVLVGPTALGGIKLGTVREESTPRTRSESPFTLKTDNDSSKRTQPGRAHRGIAAEPPRLGRPPEGLNFSERQGGPR